MDKHMAGPPVKTLIERVGKEELVDAQVIMTTKGNGVVPKL